MSSPTFTVSPRPRRDLLQTLLGAGAASIALFAGIYAAVGHWPAAAVELTYLVVVLGCLLWVRLDEKATRAIIWVNQAGVLGTIVANTLVTGGIHASGAFVIWGLIAPLSAMVFLGLKPAIGSLAVFAAVVVALALLPPGTFDAQPLPPAILPWVAAANTLGSAALCLIAIGYFLRRVEREQQVFEATEHRLRETQRLESLAVLAGGIAHDFNNVLMALFGNLQMVRSELPEGSPAAVRLSRADAALEQATNLTRQLLSFASGGAPVRSRASIADTIRESAAFVLTGSQVRGQYTIPADLWPVVADVGQISRLLQNLVINASQAMPGGGTVHVHAENTERDGGEGPTGRCVRVEVRDTGHGIPESLRARVFEPFFSTRPGSTGLGLTTCYAIVRDHGGHIEMESEVSVGTTFRVWLPAAAPSDARPEPVPAVTLACREDLAGLRILVMDDEPSVLEVLCAMLDSLGHQAVGTAEGGEAITAWREADHEDIRFNAVILDLTVRGGMGGVQTAQRLREIGATAPLIASSGYATDRILADFREFGFDAVLRKPYRVEELRAVLHRVVEGVAQA